jgi:hypothetical protein
MRMRAGHGRRSRGVATLGVCLAMMAIGVVLPAVGSALPRVPLAQKQERCVPLDRDAPCLGRIQSGYAFSGLGSGALSLIRAKLSREEEIGRDAVSDPILQRTFTWHSVPSVRMRAVYVVSAIGNTGKYRFHRIPTGSHSGHVTLTAVVDHRIPTLLLEGERTAARAVASVASNHCKSFTTETPCLGPIQTLFTFTGKAGGAVRSIKAKLGSEEEVGKNPEGIPIERRRFTWHAATGIKLVAAFVLTTTTKNGKAVKVRGQYRWIVHRIPTGTHGGTAILTASEGSTFTPFLLVEGQ